MLSTLTLAAAEAGDITEPILQENAPSSDMQKAKDTENRLKLGAP